MNDKTRVENIDCMDLEIWKMIPDSNNLYMVSSMGRIKSLRSGKLMIPLKTTTGYYQIQLWIDGCKKQFRIHRIVGAVFIPNPFRKPEINHKDGNRLNNNVSNLEWCTRSENAKHAYNSGLNKKTRPVICLQDGNIIKKYKSARDAESDGYSNQLIAKCCLGHRKTHKGKSWIYA